MRSGRPSFLKRLWPGWRTVADGIAVVVFALVVYVGATTIEGDDEIAAPKTVTTVAKAPVEATAGTRNKTIEVTRTGNEPASRTTTTKIRGQSPERPAETQVTTEEGERSFLERVLGEGGLTILQIAVVVLAAFFAAAIVQRVLLGEYGGFEFGSFKLSAVARASTVGLKELRDDLDKRAAEIEKKLKGTEQDRLKEDLDIREDLAIAYKRMDLIDRRLDHLNSGHKPTSESGEPNA